MAASSSTVEMQAYSARLETFQRPHHLGKRRASSQASKKKKEGTVEWPHKTPTPEQRQMARAGFFHRPTDDFHDNVQCFMCSVKLDGWEETDDAIKEHLAHSPECAYATAISVSRHHDPTQALESRDPMSEAMVAARHMTFSFAEGWPHEDKKGWKCKIAKMVDAGWCWDPNPSMDEDKDGVTCFYCDLSLDGWEPKDDPLEEHKRRSPDCQFFALVEKYHGSASGSKIKKAKGRGKASARTSTASKASRLSTQSAMSDATDVAFSAVELSLDEAIADPLGDDGTISEAAEVQKQPAGAKKPARSKATTKGGKGKKKNATESQPDEIIAPSESSADAPRAAPADKHELSVMEVDEAAAAPAKKTGRGRKAKSKAEVASKQDVTAARSSGASASAILSKSELRAASAQLQDELEDSMEMIDYESTPQPKPAKPKRGVKRTSDGVSKRSDDTESIAQVDAVMPSKSKSDKQSKRGRKPKQASAVIVIDESQIETEVATMQADLDTELGTSSKATKKGKGRPKSKKASTVRSSNETVVRQEALSDQEDELAGFDKDEAEIEAELERIAAEESTRNAIAAEQDLDNEFEPSPSAIRVNKHIEVAEDSGQDPAVKETLTRSPSRLSMPAVAPSPSGSDKENQPSSVVYPIVSDTKQPVISSPTKIVRVPLAPGTPNRSPTKMHASPSKHISHLTSAAPWIAVDLDSILLASPQPTPGRLTQQLTAAAGALTSPEKTMSVEAWVKYRAEQSEAELKRRCEEMVAAFEREGMRALRSLNEIDIIT